ncbi:MAG: ATP-dependent DNA helicase RecG [Candidatus Moraniibacteriota bacterium]|nr:MAG: ATP-dependent DNA helicase RecG [Candidatus Moranbacteria bacterium]
MIDITQKLDSLPRISKTYAKKCEKLGLFTIRDLLFHFPTRYEDFSHTYDIAELSANTSATIIGKVTDINTTRIYKRNLTITTAIIHDSTGSINAIWFNQPFIEKSISTEKQLRISGKISFNKKNGLHFASPSIERLERTPTSTGRLVPIYPETAGITSKWIRWQIQMIFEKDFTISDTIPKDILDELHLPKIKRSLKLIHFPRNVDDHNFAHKRFIFEEMFLLQIVTLQSRVALAQKKAQKISFDKNAIKKFVDSLPFTPTNAQKKSAFQILTDIQKTVPMNRLLNGDVGAGKTLVAAIAALQCALNKKQIAILAPTEVLAKQHFDTLLSFFENYDISIGLLTGSYKNYGTHPALIQTTTRPKMLNLINSGEVRIVIGTHAIIQEDVAFKNLALIIVDEQHRFGVAQRAKLAEKSMNSNDGKKNTVPHFLTMTATPIPRTFALALFGDLSVSVLDEKPKNRKEIKTKLIHPENRVKIYEFIKKEISNGRQAYIILPLVEESETLQDVRSAKSEFERLQKEDFSNLSLGLMYGKLKSKEKEQLMSKFENGSIDVLISTSVVEVGVDVPNATVMIIENAERFGLSQLHQFRGRIGRGEHQSYCFLLSTHFNSKRLQSMEQYTDGFKLAQIDLDIRGPGEFLGSQQSGIPDGAMKNIANTKLITLTREYAKKILQKDPSLTKHKNLKKEIAHFYTNIHME